MRSLLMTTVALAGLAAGPAFAQIGSTQTPPSPSASSQMPQPLNATPAGSATSGAATPGSALGTTPAVAAGQPYVGKRLRPVVSRGPVTRNPVAPASLGAPGVAPGDQSAPPTSAYRGGAGSPFSTQASNTSASNARSEIAPRLPEPNAAANTPRELLMAAQRALNQGHTGAAQEALERAETRILSRTTDPSMAGEPDQQRMVTSIGQARRALGARDIAGARSAIQMAMDAPVPPRGPATTTSIPASTF